MKIAATVIGRLLGLRALGNRGEELLLIPCRSIHTFGMASPIDVAFLSRRGCILDVHRNVAPGRLLRCRGAEGTIERFSRPGTVWYEPGQKIGLSAQGR